MIVGVRWYKKGSKQTVKIIIIIILNIIPHSIKNKIKMLSIVSIIIIIKNCFFREFIN